jgi:hypothetical protein
MAAIPSIDMEDVAYTDKRRPGGIAVKAIVEVNVI